MDFAYHCMYHANNKHDISIPVSTYLDIFRSDEFDDCNRFAFFIRKFTHVYADILEFLPSARLYFDSMAAFPNDLNFTSTNH